MPDRPQHVAVISGLSGAGKTATSKLFEDLGYTVVDNLPAELVPGLAELVASEPGRFERVAIVLDVRSGDPRVALGAVLGALEGRRIALQLISFGFKYGVPLESDLVFDVRFMENPFYDPDLRPLSGLTGPVRAFVLAQPPAQRFLAFAHDFFGFAIPAYVAEGRNRLTVAIGDVGGYHRSITVAEELAADWRTRDFGPVSVWHRDLERA